jgi:hypothetical protein
MNVDGMQMADVFLGHRKFLLWPPQPIPGPSLVRGNAGAGPGACPGRPRGPPLLEQGRPALGEEEIEGGRPRSKCPYVGATGRSPSGGSATANLSPGSPLVRAYRRGCPHTHPSRRGAPMCAPWGLRSAPARADTQVCPYG